MTEILWMVIPEWVQRLIGKVWTWVVWRFWAVKPEPGDGSEW